MDEAREVGEDTEEVTSARVHFAGIAARGLGPAHSFYLPVTIDAKPKPHHPHTEATPLKRTVPCSSSQTTNHGSHVAVAQKGTGRRDGDGSSRNRKLAILFVPAACKGVSDVPGDWAPSTPSTGCPAGFAINRLQNGTRLPQTPKAHIFWRTSLFLICVAAWGRYTENYRWYFATTSESATLPMPMGTGTCQVWVTVGYKVAKLCVKGASFITPGWTNSNRRCGVKWGM